MRRHLDLAALRSFVAVADAGGVTRAAGLLNLTQSAVSMQIKRLETLLDVSLFDRSHRQVRLTGVGEELLSDARRILALNDAVVARMTGVEHEGDIVLGVPHDIVYPVIPSVLKRFQATFPKMRINLQSLDTRTLKDQFARGEAEVILTTEVGVDPGGETLLELPLYWVGSKGGHAHLGRPVRIAFERRCIFGRAAQTALDAAGIPWENAVDSDNTRTVEASVTADLAVSAALDGTWGAHMYALPEACGLPALPSQLINLYQAPDLAPEVVDSPRRALIEMLREGYRAQLGGDHNLAGGATAA
ncbi:MAG: LysR family transcriptional regulator [Pseudomonadota bacterium]